MTKVQITYKLARILNDADLKQVARLHAVYGLFAARLAATGDEMVVEYDASRLGPKEVQGVLEQHGIPLQP
jgi:energy-converting hydrogenase Eha subunit F